VRTIRKAEQQQQEVKRMNLNVPVELHNAFKSTTAAQGENMTDVILEFIRNYVSRHLAAAQPKRRRR
jgi:hypothetical protein